MDNILLHIGLAKAGSKSLQAWFRAHPQLHYVPDAIAGFSDTRSIMEFAVSGSNENPLYYVTSNELLGPAWIGPKTSGASWSEQPSRFMYTTCELRQYRARVCTILHDLFPNGRVLIVTRGFRASLHSGFSEYLKLGGSLDYLNFLNTFKMNFQHWLDLNNLIQLYETIFGQQKLLVLPFELLKESPPGFFGRIENWLGLDHFESDYRQMNPSLTPQELYWYPRFSKILACCKSKRAYKYYLEHFLVTFRMRRVVRFLGRFGNRQVMFHDCPDEYLSAFKDNATILKQNPLYASYSAEYLWDDNPPGNELE